MKQNRSWQLVVGLLLAGLFSGRAWGHGSLEPQSGTRVAAAISTTWRDEGALLTDGLWLIPGVLMGGEAYPVSAGTSVDEARISLSHRTQDNVFGYLQLSSHDGSSTAEVHHALVGVALSTNAVTTTLSAGRMAAAMTPANGEHASDRLFSEAPLALDAFLGRQLNDEGVSLVVAGGPLRLGMESWRGRAFPATADDEGGSYDAYLHYLDHVDNLRWHAGLWWLQADALNRTDNRYVADGHQHGSSITAVPQYWFDGRSELLGAFVRLGWQWTANSRFDLDAQWMQVDVAGTIRDSTRLARLEGNYNGGWLQASMSYRQHQWGVRWERLALVNDIEGAAAGQLAEVTSLYNAGDDPQRISLIYSWQMRQALALRLEATDDRTQPDSVRRVALGAVWRMNLLP